MSIEYEIRSKGFANGRVYALETHDDFLVEVTDTFLPHYTKDTNLNNNTNKMQDYYLGDRNERWLIGVSCMSGCPIRCKFCATGEMRKWRNLTAEEIVEQVDFVVNKNPNFNPSDAKEFKINYTRMGEPFLNISEVKRAIKIIDSKYKNVHHYISTVGLKGSDFSWIKGNITLQVSLHSLIEENRNILIPFKDKLSIEELGKIRTDSNLKTTLNLTLVNEEDFNIELLKKYFDNEYFFVKLSPINPNSISDKNNISEGVIKEVNLK